MIKLFKPFVSWRARWYVLKVLMGTQLAEGPVVKQFEHEFARKFNKKNVCAVNSGTSALELAVELAGINQGDEVLTPVLTCTATNLPLLHRKARIVFVDTDVDLNINVQDLESKITPKTKAVVFVHFGGNNRGLDTVVALCKKHKIKLIEDAAQAIGSKNWGKGDFTCVSLQAIKVLTSGDGGALICKKDSDHAKAKRLRWFGYDRDLKHKKGDTDIKEAGYKYHMNDISAAIGLGNLRSIDAVLQHLDVIRSIYKSYGITAHTWLAHGELLPYKETKEFFQRRGVECGQHHYRNDKYSVFPRGNKLPVMDRIQKNYYFLPFNHSISIKQAHYIGNLYQLWLKLRK